MTLSSHLQTYATLQEYLFVSLLGSGAPDHETHRRRRAATDVQRRNPPGTHDLVITSSPSDLPMRVEDHPDPAGTDRMTHPDQASAGVHGDSSAKGQSPRFHRLPTTARRGDPEMVDGHVLTRRETVVGLDPVDVFHLVRPARPKASRMVAATCGITRSSVPASFGSSGRPTVRCPQPSM